MTDSYSPDIHSAYGWLLPRKTIVDRNIVVTNEEATNLPIEEQQRLKKATYYEKNLYEEVKLLEKLVESLCEGRLNFKLLTVSKVENLNLDGRTWFHTMHLNGGNEFFGQGYTHSVHRRLTAIHKTFKKTGLTTIEYKVDGIPCTSEVEGIQERLSYPPEITLIEQLILIDLPEDFDPEYKAKKLFPYERLKALEAKGLIQWRKGTCWKTDLGIAACAIE